MVQRNKMKTFSPVSVNKVAIIGCGAIASTHIQAILKTGKQIAALCDIEKDKAIKLAVQFHLDNCGIYSDYQEMLTKESIQCVHICTPHYLHSEMVMYALEHNISVLCEKPICITETELNSIQSTYEKMNSQLGVCFQNRYLPINQYVKEKIAPKATGAYATVVWKRDKKYYDSGEWRGKKETEGGGVLINQAIHTLDLLLWALGEPETILSNIQNWEHKDCIDVEDFAMISMKNAKGQMYQLFATTAGSGDYPITINFTCEDGTLYHVENNFIMRNNSITIAETENKVFEGKSVWGDGHNSLVQDFYEHLEKGIEFPININEAGKTVHVLNKIYNNENR